MRTVPIALCTVVLLALAGCRLPGGAPSGPDYQVTADFTDVLDLVPQAAVKVNDVTVGSVRTITLGPEWTARVHMRIDRDVHLPANATATIRQSSLLGEKFVSLSAPQEQPAEGTLADGAVIPVSRTTRTAEVEEVLAALGLLLNGGGLAQLKTISDELTAALRGRESTVVDLLHQLDTFLGGLDEQRADILRATDALDRFSAHLAAQRDTLRTAIDALDPGLTVLADQRAQLTQALTALSDLSTVGTRVVDASRDDTLATLRSLRPLLDQLVRAGDALPRSLTFLLAYPFPPNATSAIHGDYVNMHLTLDLDGARILSNLLTVAPPAGAAAGSPAAAPAKPGSRAQAAGAAHPSPSPAPSASPGLPAVGGGAPVGGTCSLLDILTGVCLP